MKFNPIRKVPGAGRVKSIGYFYVLRAVLSTVLFMLVYYSFIKALPQDIFKLGWVILDSYLTGLAGLYLARYISGYWRFRANMKSMLAGLLVALFYGFFVYFGGILLFLDNADLWQAFLILLIVRGALTWGAELLSLKTTTKLARGITG